MSADRRTLATVEPKPFVFSIRPAYVTMFRRGVKVFELRTRRPSVSRGERHLVYETSPVCKVVAVATIGSVIVDRPGRLWSEVGDLVGVDDEEFWTYFKGRKRAVAIEMRMEWLVEPLPLPAGMRAPQSWARWKGAWPP